MCESSDDESDYCPDLEFDLFPRFAEPAHISEDEESDRGSGWVPFTQKHGPVVQFDFDSDNDDELPEMIAENAAKDSGRILDALFEGDSDSVSSRKRFASTSEDETPKKINVASYYTYFADFGKMSVEFLERALSVCGLQSTVKLIDGWVMRATTYSALGIQLISNEYASMRSITGTHLEIVGLGGKGENKIVSELICETELAMEKDSSDVELPRTNEEADGQDDYTIVILPDRHVEREKKHEFLFQWKNSWNVWRSILPESQRDCQRGRKAV